MLAQADARAKADIFMEQKKEPRCHIPPQEPGEDWVAYHMRMQALGYPVHITDITKYPKTSHDTP